jgi:ABC-2 type transport system ATP-binding protein
MNGGAQNMPDASLAIELSGVEKVYNRRVHALRGVDVRIARGEIFGLLGPNGAGKSTLVKILMTVIRPTACRGTVLGDPVGRKSTLKRVGYLPEHNRFPDYLTGAQVLDYLGGLSGVDRATRRARSTELLGLVGMDRWGTMQVRKYSKGMRQRIGIAAALINDPDLVVLDEPTDGVDPVGRRDIRDVVRALKDRGKTVLLNSHLLSELELVCDRVAILVQGRVASQGTIHELTLDQQRYEIELAEPAPALDLADPTGVSREGDAVRIATLDPERVQPVIDALRAKGCVIRSVRAVRPSLEDLFMQAVTDASTGETLSPGAATGGKKGASR